MFSPTYPKEFCLWDETFFEFIPFFSSGKTSLQEESSDEELSSSSTIPLPVPIPSFHFDNPGVGRERGTELKVYTRRKKKCDSDR